LTLLSGYEELFDDFKARGVDEVICLTVNDAFVMFQWSRHMVIEKTTLLPDGPGRFTRMMGMLADKDNLGFGCRSWRYSMLAVDGEVENLFVKPGYGKNAADDPFEISNAQTMLDYLNQRMASAAA